ncbi:hypothetical protein EMPS_02128 [Entomortierella parvispora]|uniref:Uncharacterized protein n=1 Tax=Entomortierella parvispora TaxID=205924 RepID=A0A9P3H443_9FUNG|nr:hypothetical protein EMPS_02128 [Entomortierella parvispora]
MWIPFPYTSPSSSSAGADGSGIAWTISQPQPSVITPNTASTRHQAISFLLPIIIIGVFLAIVGSTLLIAQCLYRRIKTLHITSSAFGTGSSSWRSYYSPNGIQDDNGDDDDGLERGERERLLERRQSTSYFNTNRTRAPVPVIIRHDTHGRPISTWSTASSVAARRGEELSKWTRRRDDLIQIYGRSSQLYTSGTEDADVGEGRADEDEDERGDTADVNVKGGKEITFAVGHSPAPPIQGVHAHDHENAHTHTRMQSDLSWTETETVPDRR